MSRRTFWKILTLLIAISMLGAGFAPASPNCTEECCAQSKGHASHTMVKPKSSDLLPDCCSGSETAPCPHMLESASESKPYAISAVPAEVDPPMVELAVAEGDTSFIRLSHQHVAALIRPPIRGPSIPLFLQNLSLLI